MKQEQADKYSVAWFKLAECVSRREKERALGVYRLLSHSFENPAVGHQLEGDILLAFNDRSGAVKTYEKAAQLYCEQKELTQATAVYDHLFTVSGDQQYVEKIILLYAQLKQPAQVLVYMRHLCLLMLRRQDVEQMSALLERFQLNAAQRIGFVTEIAYLAVADHLMPSAMKSKAVHAALDLVMTDVQLLSKFFSKIKAIDPHYYQEACAYVEQAS